MDINDAQIYFKEASDCFNKDVERETAMSANRATNYIVESQYQEQLKLISSSRNGSN